MTTADISLPKALKGQVLTWIGVLGATITLVGNLGTLITLANWCQWLVDHYKWATEQVAAYITNLVTIEISGAEIAYSLYFLFLVSLALGARAMSSHEHLPIRFRAIQSILLLILLFAFYRAEAHYLGAWELHKIYYSFFVIILICVVALNFPNLRTPKDYLHAGILSLLLYLAHWVMNTGKLFNLYTLWGLSDLTPFQIFTGHANSNLVVTSFVLLVVPILPHLIASYRPLLYRCAFVAVGVGLLLALSEISRLLA